MQYFLKAFYEAWGVDIATPILANDKHKPVESFIANALGLRQVEQTWGASHSIANDVLSALQRAGELAPESNHFLKLDVDVIHFDNAWFRNHEFTLQNREPQMLGIEGKQNVMQSWPFIWGAAYVINRCAINQLVDYRFACKAEDRAISKAIQDVRGDFVAIRNQDKLTGAQALDYSEFEALTTISDMIHCGEFRRDRRAGAAWMKRVVNLSLTTNNEKPNYES